MMCFVEFPGLLQMVDPEVGPWLHQSDECAHPEGNQQEAARGAIWRDRREWLRGQPKRNFWRRLKNLIEISFFLQA